METHLSKTAQLAREAGIIDFRDAYSEQHVQAVLEKLKAFEALVRADERSACAKVCEELVPDMSRTPSEASVWDVATFDCAAAIRARGETK